MDNSLGVLKCDVPYHRALRGHHPQCVSPVDALVGVKTTNNTLESQGGNFVKGYFTNINLTKRAVV